MKKRYTYLYTLLLFVMPLAPALAQYSIKWHTPFSQSVSEEEPRYWLNCDNSFTDEANGLPVIYMSVPGDFSTEPEVMLNNAVFETLDSLELIALQQTGNTDLPGQVEVSSYIAYSRDQAILQVLIHPLRKNETSGAFEKLVAFDLDIDNPNRHSQQSKEMPAYASSSVLASGDWFRIAISKTGIYQLTYSDLAAMGLNVSGLSSSSIRLHGYGGGMLPERAGLPRYDDLPETPVMIVGGGDGTFDPGDYLLFYGRGPLTWQYNASAGHFEHRQHLYSNHAFYFITTGSSPGRRIVEFQQPQSSGSQIVTSYNWRDVFHPDEVNLIKSGKEWLGDIFDLVTTREYTFGAFEPLEQFPFSVRFSAAARSTTSSSFTLSAADESFQLYLPPIVNSANTSFASLATQKYQFANASDFTGITLKYNKSLNSSVGWLNYLEVNAQAKLSFAGGQFGFRKSGLQSGVATFQIANGQGVSQLWDVTDPLNPGYIVPQTSGSVTSFKALADTIREYVVAATDGFYKPDFTEPVENQDLHSFTGYDMVIVTHPLFADEAARLATFHVQNDNLSVLLVQAQAIYNEFSSGAQDISAIRDFMRMLWHKAPEGREPRFLLLFGDASYDYKDVIVGNTNFIPTYQSPESMHTVSSYATDDFFGSIDDGEGGLSTDVMDIGVGRFVVTTPEEAKMAVDKVIHYTTATEKVNGDWRNVIVFVADDGEKGDGITHMSQADQLATMIDTTYPNYNMDKIFLDAYPQISTPGGPRMPNANEAINQRMEKGALIVNYTGHGGETGWSMERVLEVADVNSWTNYDRLPVFMTATCEFSRYDDPLRVSAGEAVFLNPRGGGIALFTTSRPTFGTPNFTLARNFYTIALRSTENGMPHLGDLIRISKAVSGPGTNNKKFVLLGDPAMKMAYPGLKVETTGINDQPVAKTSDTLRALGQVTISGKITDNAGLEINDFNGLIYPIVFDKESKVVTLGADGITPMTFSVRRNIIYKGKVRVENGKFSFSFIVPRDIAYNYGEGKISYYASDGVRDAAGNYMNIVIGGISDEQLNDQTGPEIELYMNEKGFRPGGFTDENPHLLAYLRDDIGINTIGNSIGHDIVAILDNNTGEPYILNEFYEADLNTYKSGQIRFPFRNLAPGTHEVKLRVWDVNNNPAEQNISFVVRPSDEMTLGNLIAYPNPTRGPVTIELEHNQAGRLLEAELSIYSLSGTLVASLKQSIFADGYRTVLFDWNGVAANGATLSPGFYIGRLLVKSEDGPEAAKSVKILIAR